MTTQARQELVLGAILAGSHVRLPASLVWCFDPPLNADIAVAIAQCRDASWVPDPRTIARLTGINVALLEEMAARGEEWFGLEALDLVLDVERDANRRTIALAGDALHGIAREPDPRAFDAARDDLVASGLFAIPRVVGGTRPRLLNVRPVA